MGSASPTTTKAAPRASPRRPIALIGFMGSGKSTVGTALGNLLGPSGVCVDTDFMVEQDATYESGLANISTVAELFAREGEDRFREREASALMQLLNDFAPQPTSGWLVIPTGGGIVLREENRRRLRESCFVVWLTARVETILARVQAEAHARPLIAAHADQPEALRAHILTMLAQRGPLYQETAHLVVDTSDREPSVIAREILRKYERAIQQEGRP